MQSVLAHPAFCKQVHDLVPVCNQPRHSRLCETCRALRPASGTQCRKGAHVDQRVNARLFENRDQFLGAARAVAYGVDRCQATRLPILSRSSRAALPRGAAISTRPMLFSYQKGPLAFANVRA